MIALLAVQSCAPDDCDDDYEAGCEAGTEAGVEVGELRACGVDTTDTEFHAEWDAYVAWCHSERRMSSIDLGSAHEVRSLSCDRFFDGYGKCLAVAAQLTEATADPDACPNDTGDTGA